MKVNVSMDLTVEQAFKILLDILHVRMDDNPPKFEIHNGEIVCDDDDRGELYLALYHLATKIFPNTEFRHLFDNPNTLMNKLYVEKENVSTWMSIPEPYKPTELSSIQSKYKKAIEDIKAELKSKVFSEDWVDNVVYLDDCLEIIDKYTAENEEE